MPSDTPDFTPGVATQAEQGPITGTQWNVQGAASCNKGTPTTIVTVANVGTTPMYVNGITYGVHATAATFCCGLIVLNGATTEYQAISLVGDVILFTSPQIIPAGQSWTVEVFWEGGGAGPYPGVASVWGWQ